MTKRDAFWGSIWAKDGETVAWPAEPEARKQLASKIVGAAVVGATEHVLVEALEKLNGAPPASGSEGYVSALRDAKVMASLSDEQREVTARLLRETAHSALYWPLAKVCNLPGVTVKLMASRQDRTPPETFDLTELLDPHQLLLEWLDDFGELPERD